MKPKPHYSIFVLYLEFISVTMLLAQHNCSAQFLLCLSYIFGYVVTICILGMMFSFSETMFLMLCQLDCMLKPVLPSRKVLMFGGRDNISNKMVCPYDVFLSYHHAYCRLFSKQRGSVFLGYLICYCYNIFVILLTASCMPFLDRRQFIPHEACPICSCALSVVS